MAYMNQEKKKRLAPQIKEILKKHNMKGTLSVNNYSTLNLTLQSGPIDFKYTGQDGRTIRNINEYWYQDHYKDYPKLVEFLDKLIAAMKGPDYFNHDDSQSDYFYRSHYTNINFGRWDKPYINKGNA